MAKLSKNTMIAVLILAMIVGVVAVSGQLQNALLSVSQVKILSITQTDFQSNELSVEGDDQWLVLMKVGGGSDILAGSWDVVEVSKDTLNSIPSKPKTYDAKNGFRLKATKDKMDVFVPVIPYTQVADSLKFIKQPTPNGSSQIATSCVGSDKLAGQRLDLVKSSFAECKAKPGYMAFAWYPLSDSTYGCPYFVAKARIQALCVTSEKEAVLSDWGTPSLDWLATFNLTTTDGKTTAPVRLSQFTKTANLVNPNGEVVGTLDWEFNTQLNTLPIDIKTEKPVYLTQDAKWITTAFASDWTTSFRNYKTTYMLTGETCSGSGDKCGSKAFYDSLYDETLKLSDTAFDTMQNAFPQWIYIRTSGGSMSIVPLADYGLKFNADLAFDPVVSLRVKATWLGIIRNIADPAVVCNDSQVTANAGDEFRTSANISNKGSAEGAISASLSCEGLTALDLGTYTLKAGENRLLNITYSDIAEDRTRLCTIKASAVGFQKEVTCAFTSTSLKVSTCGNDICDGARGETPITCPQDCKTPCPNGVVEAGETCYTCPLDVKCSDGYYCDSAIKDCKKLENCGNEKVDAGENCISCPKDIKCGEGQYCDKTTETCKVKGEGIDPTLLAIIGILGAGAVAGILIWRKFK